MIYDSSMSGPCPAGRDARDYPTPVVLLIPPPDPEPGERRCVVPRGPFLLALGSLLPGLPLLLLQPLLLPTGLVWRTRTALFKHGRHLKRQAAGCGDSEAFKRTIFKSKVIIQKMQSSFYYYLKRTKSVGLTKTLLLTKFTELCWFCLSAFWLNVSATNVNNSNIALLRLG